MIAHGMVFSFAIIVLEGYGEQVQSQADDATARSAGV